ncbi:MAG: 16S rRNA (cytosine(967)-C(5))-methyltransferase RsmB [Proteobacteria bacterium]|nr:16S rRNA (cytosine(967)-C(5))-methyltransferase RsmB [Pseudomonadota bacterium]
MSSRLISTKIIKRVVEDKMTLSILFNDSDLINHSTKEKALIQEMSYGTLRWYYSLDAILEQLLDKPIKKKDQVIKYLLLIGLYQLIHMNIAPHAVVSETVKTCTNLNRDWAKGFVNAILRHYIRDAERLSSINKKNNFDTAHPAWFIDRLKKDWPDKWQAILEANNQYPPMYLRVNQLKTSRDNFIKRLLKNGIEAKKTRFSEQGIILSEAIDVFQLPDFKEGFVSVQDLSAQLVIDLLDLRDGQIVLDACAAPGGKTAHILESTPGIKALTAIEKDDRRVKRLRDNLNRLGLNTNVIVDDAVTVDRWWNNEKFDRILLDAPCSATGVIRRHPDIKLLRTAKEVKTASELQLELLSSLWETLKTGGLLVYVTCSVLKEENSYIIKKFTDARSDSVIKPIHAEWGQNTGYGTQILTGENNMDGFFYARLEKI